MGPHSQKPYKVIPFRLRLQALFATSFNHVISIVGKIQYITRVEEV